MKKIKKITAFILAAVLIFTLTSCNSNSSSSSEAIKADEVTAPFNSRADETLVPETGIGTKTLVAYFSATGNTRNVAEMIAEIENADTWEIIPEQPYSKEDINYQDYNCRALKEQNDKSVRPAIAGEKIDLSGYTKIYIGYPIWATQEPRIMDTFVEAYDFGTATVIPFCTSGSSGIGSTGMRLATLAGSGEWKAGKRFPGSATEEDVRKWIESLRQ